MEGSMINEQFTASEATHSSVHFCRGDTSSCCDSSSHTGRLDVRYQHGKKAKIVTDKSHSVCQVVISLQGNGKKTSNPIPVTARADLDHHQNLITSKLSKV